VAVAPHAVVVAPHAVVVTHTEALVPNEERVAQICAPALQCGVARPHFFHVVPVSLPALALRLC